jgi:hypothetical protein
MPTVGGRESVPIGSIFMTEPRDERTRSVSPFDAPEDYADPWRGRRMPILLAAVGVIVLAVVLLILLS